MIDAPRSEIRNAIPAGTDRNPGEKSIMQLKQNGLERAWPIEFAVNGGADGFDIELDIRFLWGRCLGDGFRSVAK